MDPYEQGYDYCISGGAFIDNPYKKYGSYWYDWNEGYNDARYTPLEYNLEDEEYYTDKDRPY